MKRKWLVATQFAFAGMTQSVGAQTSLLNVSYDPTRELYQEFNESFAKHWKAKTGERVNIKQSHGGGGKQARAVIDGPQAEVVGRALAYDLDAIAAQGLIAPSLPKPPPAPSGPYPSTN